MKKMIRNQNPVTFLKAIPKTDKSLGFVAKIFLPFLLAFFAMNVNGQQIEELNSKLATMKGSPDPVVRAEGNHLESLVYSIQPTLYFENGQLVVTPTESALRVNTDVQSLNAVVKNGYSQVEILIIKIQRMQDLQMSLDLARLSNYPALKYVYIQCSVDLCPGQTMSGNCEVQRISDMISGSSNKTISITYSVSIPS
jgi:hypothetical protein